MRTVLAALDASAAARPVLLTANAIAALMDATVEAVHVADRTVSAETPALLAAQHHVPLRRLSGRTQDALLDALSADDVVAAVLGARGTPTGRRPTGHIALDILQRARKPVVVVPPQAPDLTPPLRRILVPLEGTAASSRAVTDGLCPLLVHDVELVVLHVFTAETMPRALDRPARDLELLGTEFLARHCPEANRIELRAGAVDTQIRSVCTDQDIDLVVLSWSQDPSPGRAAIVRDVLAHTDVPVLVLPAAPAALAPGSDAVVQTSQ